MPPAAHVPTPVGGEVIAGKYLVEEVLGTGGMSVVLRVRHAGLRHSMALKMPRSDRVASPTQTERFLREARALARLTSEHACRVLDLGTTDGGVPFIVMELLQGESVAQRVVRDGPMPVPEAVRYICHACDALDEVHALGIVHRDIKPANLFIVTGRGGRSSLKVLDFGISKVANPSIIDARAPLTMDTSMLGTPAYMAPEQIESSMSVDARADVWALGVCLYIMITGQRPFTSGSSLETALAVLRDPPRPPRELRPDLPPELERIILRCLEKDPARRTKSAESLARALSPFAGVMTPWPPVHRPSQLSVSEEIVVDVDVPVPVFHAEPEPSGAGILLQASSVPPSAGTVPPPMKPRVWPRIAFGAAMVGLLAVGALSYLDVFGRARSAQAIAPPAAPIVAAQESASAAPSAAVSAAPRASASATHAKPQAPRHTIRPQTR